MKNLIIILLLIITISLDVDKKYIENFNLNNFTNCFNMYSLNHKFPFKIIKQQKQTNYHSNYNNKSKCIDEHFTSLPYMWIYIDSQLSSRHWDSFYSKKVLQNNYSIIDICIKLITLYNKNLFNIVILYNDNINNYIKNYSIYPDKFINKQYIKYYLLYHYGGLWIEPDTIPFKNFKIIIDKLSEYDSITFGNKYINDNIIGFKKNNNITKNILNYINKQKNIIISSFYIHNNIKLLLNCSQNNFNFDHSYDASIDYQNNIITIDNLVSNNYTLFKNTKNILFLNLNINLIEKSIKYKWFLNLSQKELLNSNMWISKLLAYSFKLKQKIYAESQPIIEKKTKEINVFPNDIYDLYDNIRNSNILPYSPYLLIHKESIRNT